MAFKKKEDIKAACIKYFKENLDTPVITAMGSGKIAEKIIEKARENNIKIINNDDFFKYDKLFNLGEEIPYEVYKIVIDILVKIINTNEGIFNAKDNSN